MTDIMLDVLAACAMAFLAFLFWPDKKRCAPEPSPVPREASQMPVQRKMPAAPISGEPLRVLARMVDGARLNNGMRVLDSSDFKAWLLELAEDCDRVVAS
jgi:hypothetical protein